MDLFFSFFGKRLGSHLGVGREVRLGQGGNFYLGHFLLNKPTRGFVNPRVVEVPVDADRMAISADTQLQEKSLIG
jgi:hypothetical protein